MQATSKSLRTGFQVCYLFRCCFLISIFDQGSDTIHSILYLEKGDSYDGELSFGERDGFGIQYFANGNKYEGNWTLGILGPIGIMYFKGGDVYEGEFLQGVICGNGEYRYTNGNKFIGRFKNAMREGKGKMVFQSGKVTLGTWTNNQLQGYAIEYQDGDFDANFWLKLFVNGTESQKDESIGSNLAILSHLSDY